MSQLRWHPGIQATVVLTVDVDAEAGVLWEHPAAATRLGVMSHQAYAARSGVPRLLKLLADYSLRGTFFVPGYTAERYPDTVRAIVAAGHEVAHHGYLHEVVTELDEEREAAVLERTSEILERLVGVRPDGWRAPMWELNQRTPRLLADHGFAYDSSLMDDDSPYLLAVSGQRAAATLVEIPPHWSRDDGQQYAWLPWIWDTATIESPTKLAAMWTLDVQAALRERSCVTFTLHPCLSGQPARAYALTALFERLSEPDVWVPTCAELAAHVRAQLPEPIVHRPVVIDPADLPTQRRSLSPSAPSPSSGADGGAQRPIERGGTQ